MSGILINIIPAIALAFIMQLLLHEVGHLIGGFLTGWRFIYLQFFNLAAVSGGKSVGFVLLPTRNFQCIMSPKSVNTDPLIYTIGGCVMNLILSAAGLAVMIMGYTHKIVFLYSWSFFAMGMGLLVMNGIPRVKQICNDMACYALLKKDQYTRICHNAQFQIARHLYDGVTYKDIGEEIICLSADTAYNDIIAYHTILEYYYYLDRGDKEKQEKALARFVEANASSSIISIWHMESLYSDLIRRIERNDYSLPDKDPYPGGKDAYIINNETKGDVHTERVKAVYTAFKELADGKIERAKNCLSGAILYIRSMKSLYEGEKVFCINQLAIILELLKNRCYSEGKTC